MAGTTLILGAEIGFAAAAPRAHPGGSVEGR